MSFKRKIYPYLLILPIVILMLGLVFYPAVVTFIDSFKSMKLTRPDDIQFVGLSNYIQLLTDADVLQAFINTSWYFLLAVVLEVIGGLVFALVLEKKFRGRGIVLAAVILPWAFPPVVNSAIWKWIYDPTYGVFNDILLRIGMIDSYQPMLAEPGLAVMLIMIVHIWKMIPLVTIILLAVLQTIPDDLHQAAQIDGASWRQRFLYITLPLLKPAIVIVLTQATIASINLFDEIYVLTGTALHTRSLMIQTYLTAFRELNLGLGMALSFMTTTIILLLCMLFIFLLRDRGEK